LADKCPSLRKKSYRLTLRSYSIKTMYVVVVLESFCSSHVVTVVLMTVVLYVKIMLVTK